jgi:SAM-dependent methyltransferase
MRNCDKWRPTKFVQASRVLRASRDPRHVGVPSRMIVDIVAPLYAAILRSHARGVLLDLGCGYSPLFETYQPLVTDTFCVDWGNSLHVSPYLDLIADLNKPIPFRDHSFDTILLTDVLEHVAEPRCLISEIARLLRPGGKLLGGVPFLYWLHEEPHDYCRFTSYALRSMFLDAGLHPVEISPYGGLLEVLIDLGSKGCVSLREWMMTPVGILQSVATPLLKTKPFRKISGSTGRKFPLGYVFVGQKVAS